MALLASTSGLTIPIRPHIILAHCHSGNVWRTRTVDHRRNLLRRASSQQPDQEVPDLSYDVVGQKQELFRALPLGAGAFGIIALLANRLISGIAPVVDSSSSQSRTDVLGIIMSAVLLLTGLQWLAIKPRTIKAVALDGEESFWVDTECRLPASLIQELTWSWRALRSCTRCRSLVLIYDGRCLLYAGMTKTGQRPAAAKGGDICNSAMQSGQGNYLANLMLYPGRLEFTSFLPENTQGVVVQPVGSKGVLIAGTDTVRGIGRLDQAWLAAISDKLESSLEDVKMPQPGVGFGGKGAKGKESAVV
mmetsp:Transcript_11404/g.20053  ORF Transcript_11404/g.20053 Transcript_11404/m.20053 type:complete len:305 (+) Transcript_11404:69-983(+)|eukprot:CAMPEP_0119104658 /NCGR_PEP_ID=MMETSP1180-20130426/2816_1 /TAXON_ID=3052 ORGANISM="Chlamydomonas cf sp, Strain CCMP681" /NCGR_SAMPLE_ID=MMETSP1180 /ASSEMBLY_ACC=CAM_ASM_000741 /LENGTH=304 /DNA_ID=CAMNT_0007089477 /DNA_START=69 /DNA_END=983 /DNA_ORIENTATION=-